MTALIPELAAELAAYFPEMEGRFIAVSEIEPFDNVSNVPTLPIGFVALVNETGKQAVAGGSSITITDDLLVHFAFKPVKYQNEKGHDTPFFAFYDYEPLRDKLLTFTQAWRSEMNYGLSYKSMVVDATEFAVYITFRFEATYKWCAVEELTEQPSRFDIVARMNVPKSQIPCIKPEPEPDHPCDAARRLNVLPPT